MIKTVCNTIVSASLKEVIYNLLDDLKHYDDYTYQHSCNVALLNKKLAEELHLPTHQVEEIYIAGLLHDLGKIQIPIQIINKKGRLTEKEYNYIKRHVSYGNDRVKSLEVFTKPICDGILYHHEDVNGNGYLGLRKNEIPLYAKITRITDSYDAITHKRAYHNKLTEQEALQIIYEGCDRAYDRNIFKGLLSLLGKEGIRFKEESVS